MGSPTGNKKQVPESKNIFDGAGTRMGSMCDVVPPYLDLGFLNDDAKDEGYGSNESSPDWSNAQRFFGSCDHSKHCCSLVSDVWKFKEFEDTLSGDKWSSPVAPVRARVTDPGPLKQLSRDYTGINATKPVVSMDAEFVEPKDVTHHPFDRQMEIESKSQQRKQTLRKPWGIAVNTRTEQIYVTDRQFHVIIVFGPDGGYQFEFGGRGIDPGKFNRPISIAYDRVGDRVFVVDKDNHRIQAFDATGKYLFQFGCRGKKDSQFWYPWGIAVSRDGSQVAVADARNHRIQLFSSSGTYIRQFTAYSPKNDDYKTIFNYPRGIVFDLTGKYIYVTDFNLHSIFRLDIQFTRLEKIVGEVELCRPSGIDLDGDGNIIVCDSRNHSVKVFKPDGQRLAYIRSLRDSQFDLPLDLTVMPAGFIAVLDLNGRVRIF